MGVSVLFAYCIISICLIEYIANQYTFVSDEFKIALLYCIIKTLRIPWMCLFSLLLDRETEAAKGCHRLSHGPSGTIDGAIDQWLALQRWYQLWAFELLAKAVIW